MLRELSLLIDDAVAETLSDSLLARGALSVSVEDADAETAAEQPLYGEPGMEPERLAWRRSRLRLLLGQDVDATALLAVAAAELGIAAPAILSDQPVDDIDWVRQTQAQFTPTRISERLWIVPTWHQPPDADAIAVRLDPGVAFGTGTHPTTRLCLMWLDQHLKPGARVLDYGCGSGILAIAAMKLGAGDAIGIDIDPQALQAALANSAANGVAARYTEPNQIPDGVYDVVVANILSNPLKILAPALLARVAARGALVLAGVLERQADEVIAVYRTLDPSVAMKSWAAEDGWVCIAGTRS